jgi:hypothetical protein
MTTLFEFTVIAILTAGVSAVLFFGRRRIHRQMEEIAEAAKSGAFTRPVRFRPLRTLTETDPGASLSPARNSPIFTSK